MSTKVIKGSCLCNAVGYELTGNIGVFQYCHCSRCRKFTGSAHASNIFVTPDQIRWTRGESKIRHYEIPDSKYFATSFCDVCGSSLPWTSKGGKVVVVTAGTLDDDPELRPTQNIFCASQAIWYIPADSLKKYQELPNQ